MCKRSSKQGGAKRGRTPGALVEEHQRFQVSLSSSDTNEELENLQVRYDALVSVAEESGLNEGVFDATIPVACPLQRVDDEDKQVQQLLAQNGAFSASALWNVCGSKIGNARVALRAQKEQIAMRWVLPQAKATGLMRDYKKKDAIIAKLATLERDWTTYLPAREH
jgi:uncharacterized membrane protein (DUF441 family)